jgi:hypothetical protein
VDKAEQRVAQPREHTQSMPMVTTIHYKSLSVVAVEMVVLEKRVNTHNQEIVVVLGYYM